MAEPEQPLVEQLDLAPIRGCRGGTLGVNGRKVKGMFPVRLGIAGQLCVPFVCRSSSGSAGDGDRRSRLTVGHQEALSLLALMRLLRAKCVPGSTETRTSDSEVVAPRP
jgi:hypothetical protein